MGRISAGIRRHLPNTASEGAEFRAAWGVDRSASITHGSFLDQLASSVEAVRAVLRVLWNLSMIPLASGL